MKNLRELKYKCSIFLSKVPLSPVEKDMIHIAYFIITRPHVVIQKKRDVFYIRKKSRRNVENERGVRFQTIPFHIRLGSPFSFLSLHLSYYSAYNPEEIWAVLVYKYTGTSWEMSEIEIEALLGWSVSHTAE